MERKAHMLFPEIVFKFGDSSLEFGLEGVPGVVYGRRLLAENWKIRRRFVGSNPVTAKKQNLALVAIFQRKRRYNS